VSFTTITLCAASQRVFIATVVYFVIDSVRKLLDNSHSHAHSISVLQQRNLHCNQILKHFEHPRYKSPTLFMFPMYELHTLISIFLFSGKGGTWRTTDTPRL